MKKKIMAVALMAAGFMCLNTKTMAQGPYVKLGAAYNFGIGYNTDGNDYTITRSGSGSSTSTSTYELVKVNYGKGVSAGVGLGYMFNKNIGGELGIDYLIGGKSELKDVAGTTVGTNTRYSRMLLLKPSLVISSGMEGINPYARFGLVLAKGTIHSLVDFSTGSEKFESEVELSGGWGIGMQGGVGVEYNFGDNMAVYSELTMSSLNYAPEKGEYTQYSINGQDKLGDLVTREKETEFTDEFTVQNSGQSSPSEPRKDLKMSLPFSSVGIGLGIKFNF